MKKFKIDIGETDSYGFRWAVRLPTGDSIATSSWEPVDEDSELVLTGATAFDGAVTAFTVTAPETTGTHRLRNTITTTLGATLEALAELTVTDAA